MSTIMIGSHVYHIGIQANGSVLHGSWVDKPKERGTKWQWCSEDQLIKLDMPEKLGWGLGQNTVRSTGKRSLDRLIRRMTGIRPYGKGKHQPDVLLRYGGMPYNLPSKRTLIINERITDNKLKQCQIMGEKLAPESWMYIGDVPEVLQTELIEKPFHSIGGKGIREYTGGGTPSGKYLQRKFNKVREFRVHCFLWMDNPVPFIQEKVIGDRSQLCWNKKQGGAFQYVYQEGLPYGKYHGNISKANVGIMTKMAIEACKKLKMDFAGMDFGMDAMGTFKIFEANSRMGLRERSFFTYKQVMNKLFTLNINEYKAKRGW